MHSRILFLFSLLLLYGSLHAQSSRKPIDRSVFTLTAGLNTNDAYDVELSYHYMLSRYLGIGGGAGVFRQWHNDYHPGGRAGGEWDSWTLKESDKKVGRVYLRPSVLLYSPALFKIGKYDVLLTGEWGAKVLIPYTGLFVEYVNVKTHDSKLKYKSTSKGDWLFWHAKGGVSLRAHSAALTIGYGISNLDIYSARRTLRVENTSFSEFYPAGKQTHSLFIGFSHFF